MLRIKSWLAVFLVVCITTFAGFAAFVAQRNRPDPAGALHNIAFDAAISRQKLAPLEKIRGEFTFVVIGDNREEHDTYPALIEQAMKNKPDFIVNTGDQIKHPGNLNEWKKFWELSSPVQVPYFLTAGNHDEHDGGSEQIFKEQAGMGIDKPYYTFPVDNALFIVLDSEIDGHQGKIDGEQYRWLENLLANSLKKHKFVFVHRPLYPEKGKGHHYGYCLDEYPKERDRLQSLFVRYKVTAVFEGHEHLYLRKNINGIMHIITGGGGASLYADEKDGGFYHFVLIKVNGDKVVGEAVDIEGRVRDSF
jgi:3',5'-cyclic AMP phosphodiesterase CpdA